MTVESELNALKKLERNKHCANCDAYSKFGHGNVCEKYRTFVCSNCKSAHQSFSMRVKSVSMSNWTQSEVDALREENGGGNAAAQRIWFANWNEGSMRKPTENDNLEYFKRFVDKVYNAKAFYEERGVTRRENVTPVPVARPNSVAEQDLLGFASPTTTKPIAGFDAFMAAPTQASAPTNSNADWGAFTSAPATPAVETSFDPFGLASTASVSVPAPAPTNTTSSTSFDPFNLAPSLSTPAPVPASMPVTTTSTSAFDPFAPSGSSAAPTTNTSSFDPFGNAFITPTTTPSMPPSNIHPVGPPPLPKDNFGAFDALSGGSSASSMNGGFGRTNFPNAMSTMPRQTAMPAAMPMPSVGATYQASRPMMANNAGINISTYFSPAAPQSAGNQYGQPGGRDPFAGLGLPTH